MHFHNEFIRPRYEETDQMGVIYHGNYITYFEQARSGFFRALGYSYSQLEDAGFWLPIIEVGCKYFAPAKYDEEIYVKTTVSDFKGVRMSFKYDVYSVKDDELLVSGFTKHATTNKELKPISLKKKMSDFYEIVINSMEA